MGTVGEQTGDQDNQPREQVPNTQAFDLNDYTIIKEGEAEILMPAEKNKVFYNKTQVYHFFLLFLITRFLVGCNPFPWGFFFFQGTQNFIFNLGSLKKKYWDFVLSLQVTHILHKAPEKFIRFPKRTDFYRSTLLSRNIFRSYTAIILLFFLFVDC